MAGNRMHFKDTVHFITNRCEHEMFLVLPSDRITQIIQCWFARALRLYGQGLEIYAFVFLTNHIHILCRDTKGTLAAFMWYFQGNVARTINKEIGRQGRFWAREYVAQSPLNGPLHPSFRPRIKVYCLDQEKREEWLDGYRRLVGSYQEVFDGYKKAAAQGKRPAVEWPQGSYAPSCWYPIGHEEAV